MKFAFIKDESAHYPVRKLCSVIEVSKSAYYSWLARAAKLISAQELHLHRRIKVLFERSPESLGSREMAKKLREEGFRISRERVPQRMRILGLKVTQRVAYKVTTKPGHNDLVAKNLLNKNFNPLTSNTVWAGDVTYLKTGEGWMYLAVVMDLFSRRIVGWHIDKHMTTDLISKALIKAYNLRGPAKRACFSQ